MNFPHKIGCNFCHIRSFCDILQMILASYRKVHACRLVVFAQQSLSVEANSAAFAFSPSLLLFLLCDGSTVFYHFVSAIVIVSNQLFASRCILCVHIACWSAAAWGQHCAVLNSNSGVCCPHIGVFISLFLWLLSLVIAPAAWWSSSVITSCESINFRSYENAATRILQSRRPNFNRVFAFVRSHAK